MLSRSARDLGPVGTVLESLDALVCALAYQDILGQVDHHRSRPAAARDIERLVHDPRQIGHVLDQVVVLGARSGDAGRVGLLKASLPIRWVGTWPVRQTTGTLSIRASVSPVTALVAPGPRGDQDHAHLAGRSGVTFGHVHRAALLADQHMAHRVLREHRIVDRQHRAAGISEDRVHTLIDQGLYDDLRSRHPLAGHGEFPSTPFPRDGPRAWRTNETGPMGPVLRPLAPVGPGGAAFPSWRAGP